MKAAAFARFAPAAAAAAVAVSAGAALAPLTWHALGLTGGGQPPPRADLARTDPSGAAPSDVSAITAMAPFGAYAAVQEAEAQAARETELGLVLRGVLVAGRPQESAAFISRGAEVSVYGVGEAVIRGAVLSAVHPGHVELEVDGRVETLSFPEAGAESRRRAGADSMRARLSASARGTAPAPGAETAGGAPPSPEEVIEDYRRRIADNPRTVLDGLGLEAGEQGYRIRDDAPAAVRRAGLRPGDVVIRVNGEAVGDVESDRRLYDRVAASGQARVEIMRDGRVVTLSFPLN
jgi:general secretion pathway protein C